MRHTLILTTLCSLLFTGPIFAQDTPPIPRPRPDRSAIAAQSAAAQLRNSSTDQTTNTEASPTGQAAANAINSVLAGPPQSITLSAKISGEGALIPDGLIWRIYATKPNESGQVQQLDTQSARTAVFTLPPGEYLAHVAYGFAQQTQTIQVENSPIAETLIMDAGGLRLNAAITGDVLIPEAHIKFNVYQEGSDGSSSDAIITQLTPNKIIQLNAGVYHVVSNFGTVNAVVEANLRVEPGQLTEATLYHNAAQVNFRLVSEEGGDAIADVEWSITDSSGKIIFNELGTFPTTVLAEGDYTVLARRSTGVFNRDFSVVSGPSRDIEVLTQIYTNGG